MSHHRRQRQRQREQLTDIFWANKAKELGLTPARARAQAQIEAQTVARVTAALTRGLKEPERELTRHWNPAADRQAASRQFFEYLTRAFHAPVVKINSIA
jgi:hypothetical protein